MSTPPDGTSGFGAIGLAVPGSLSVGYWAITDAVNGRFLLGAAAVLFVGKMVSWWVGLGSNTSGGTLAPMFLVGATMGEMVGIAFAHALPGAHIQPGAFALVGMGATFGVGARALLTGVVFAAKATGGYGMLVPLLLATGVTELVIEAELRRRVADEHVQPPTLGPWAPRAAHCAAEAAAEGADRPEPLGKVPAEPKDDNDSEQGGTKPVSARQRGHLEVAQHDDDMNAHPANEGKGLGAGPAMVQPSSEPTLPTSGVDDSSCPDLQE